MQRIKESREFKWTEHIYPLNTQASLSIDELKSHAEEMHIEVLRRGNPYALTIYECYTHLFIRHKMTD